MSHFGDFMDGVPVKISEKYKRPPRIELPYSVSECTLRAQAVVECVVYDCRFEKNVLSKLKELRNAKETRKNERKHRLQLLEEAKQKKLDLIAAAEAEEKLKQLSVSEVSYPSTEEISEISPDDKIDKCCNEVVTDCTQDQGRAHDDLTLSTDIVYPSCTNIDSNILQPIQVMSNNQPNNLLDDPDPLQEIKLSTKFSKIPLYNSGYTKHNIDKLTFSDFENDTSSPFDNVELKTINEMELLAQVLQSQRESLTSCQPSQQQFLSHPYPTTDCQQVPGTYTEQTQQGPTLMYNAPQQYHNTNGYYLPTENSCDNAMIVDNVNMYRPNYQYYVPTNQYEGVDGSYYTTAQMTDTADVITQIPSQGYVPHHYYYGYPQHSGQYEPTMPYNITNTSEKLTDIITQSPQVKSESAIKSRSRSVPDIVKELNDELLTAKLRLSERSYNASPAPKEVASHSSSGSKIKDKEEIREQKYNQKQENLYDTLSTVNKEMCLKIHGMGFPLDRVAKICSMVGANDKMVST